MASLAMQESDLKKRLRDFTAATRYPVHDMKYQRQIGPNKEQMRKPPPPRRSEVFVHNISPDIFEDELFYAFSKIGTIHVLRLMIRPSGLANRGFCYVKYTHPMAAELAIKMLNGHEFRPGFPIKVTLSLDNNRLCLYNVVHNKTKEEIKRQLQRHKVEGIVEVQYHISYLREESNSFVIVVFESHQDAATAKKCLGKPIWMWNEMVYMKWFEWQAHMEEIRPANAKTVLIDNLGPYTSYEYIISILEVVLDMEAVNHTSKEHMMVLVQFINYEEAEIGYKLLQAFYSGTTVDVAWNTKPEKEKKENTLDRVLLDYHRYQKRRSGYQNPVKYNPPHVESDSEEMLRDQKYLRMLLGKEEATGVNQQPMFTNWGQDYSYFSLFPRNPTGGYPCSKDHPPYKLF